MKVFNNDETWDVLERTVNASAWMIKNDKIRMGLYGALSGISLARTIFDKVKNNNKNYIITITNNHRARSVVNKWVTDNINAANIKNIKLEESSPDGASPSVYSDSDSDNISRVKPARFIGEDEDKIITIDGRIIKVYSENNYTSDKTNHSIIPRTKDIVIECKTAEDREYILNKIDTEVVRNHNGQPSVYIVNRYGSKRRLHDVPNRPIESVVLQDHLAKNIASGLETFYNREDVYKTLGIPYHHGILLYGPPGTGKSSMASALANHFGKDLISISISNMEDDDYLIEAVQSVRGNSIVLLEDLDSAKKAVNRDIPGTVGVSIAGLLNTLDGVGSADGVVTVMTTNHIDKLDPAILRPGRIDSKYELGYMDHDQLRRLCSYFLGVIPEDLPTIVPDDMITPADIVGVVKNNLNTPEKTVDKIVEEVWRKKNASIQVNLPF